MFIKHLEAGRRAILIVYVDDIILIGDCHRELLRLKNFWPKNLRLRTTMGNINLTTEIRGGPTKGS